jgi:hypothetical protein
MPNELPELWPESFGENQDTKTPSTILKQAAAQLGQRTKQLVRAKVDASVRGDNIELTMWLEAPSLEYRYKLFELSHDISSFYPLHTGEWTKGGEIIVGSEDELIEYLKKVFASEKTTKLISNLMKQVRS